MFKYAIAAAAAISTAATAQVGASFAADVTLESTGQVVIVGIYDFNEDSYIDAVTVNGTAITNEVAFRRHGLATDIQREAWDAFQGAVARADIVIPPSMYDDPWAIPAGGPTLVPGIFNNPAYHDPSTCESEVMQDFYERAEMIFQGGGQPVLPLGDCVDMFFQDGCEVEAHDYWFIDENQVPWSIEDWPNGIEDTVDAVPDGLCGVDERNYTIVKCVSGFIPVDRPKPGTLPFQLTDKEKEWWKYIEDAPGPNKYFPVKWSSPFWFFDPQHPRPGFYVNCGHLDPPKPVVLAPGNRPGPISEIAPIFPPGSGVGLPIDQETTDCIQDGIGERPGMWRYWDLNPGEVVEDIDPTDFQFGDNLWWRILENDDLVRRMIEDCLPGHK